MHRMKVHFDPSFDSSAWPGPLGRKSASSGEVWTGAVGLLGILETRLGLAGPKFSDAERAAGLIPALRNTEGFWSVSFENDPVATARRLLAWRDELWLYGWRGQPVAPRLDQMANVAQNVLPGYPDRLAAVADALQSRAPEILSVTRLQPLNDVPKLWQEVFGLLGGHGMELIDEKIEDAPASGNLGAARATRFSPAESDDSLQLLRALGALMAAEYVAAWLAGLSDLNSVVVVGGDRVLDAALSRHGLPTTGAPMEGSGNALLQLLPLVLSAAWSPPHPQRALELLTLPQSPVPRIVGRKLEEALHEWPAVGSTTWGEALSQGLAAIEEEEERARVANRLKILFNSSVPHHGFYPVGEARRRVDMLVKWMHARQAYDKANKACWDAAIGQCAMLGRILDLTGLSEYSEPQIRRLVEDATEEASVVSEFPAQAGLAHVDLPDAIAGPAQCVVWWQFTHTSARTIDRLPLSRLELAALAEAGVEIPNPAQAAVAMAERWRRPLLQATEKLILVCPDRGFNGEPQYPHPLWDEIIANLADPSRPELAASLYRWELSPSGKCSKKSRPLAAIPKPQRFWSPSRDLEPREQESASSVGTLIGCPLNWVLHYLGRIRGGATAVLPEGSQLQGKLVHKIIAELFRDEPDSPDEAEARTVKLFDTMGPTLATSLFLPGAEAMRASVRRVARLAARELFHLLRSWGARVVSSEQEHRREALGVEMVGIPDLVIESPRRILDLKWGGMNYRRELLARGGAYQLADYGYVASEKGEILPSAFFILESRRLMTVSGDAFPGAETIDGPGPELVWGALEKACADRLAELKEKRVEATGVIEPGGEKPPDRDVLGEDGTLVLHPPCRFCDYGGLCGTIYGEPGR